MFCPNCGSDESHLNQYCRGCGANLNAVRTALERPDAITASAVSARDEIGRAVAAKIKDTQTVVELRQVTWELLPVVAEFLESPDEKRAKREEKRLQRIRSGVVTAAVGLGAALIAMAVALSAGDEFIPLIGIGLFTFLVGLGIVINGLFFTIPRKNAPEQSLEAGKQKVIDRLRASSVIAPVPIAATEQRAFSSSVTEHTTHQLSDKPALARPPHLTQE